MPTFGRRSQREFDTLDERLQTILRNVIRETDFTILQGRRGRAEQEEARATGRSKVGWPNSKHNCPLPQDGFPRDQWPEDPERRSLAVDVAPWKRREPHIDWDDVKAFALLAGRILQEAANQGVELRWGGDWDMDGNTRDNKFNDLPHFEIR
jgi:peptidoglycan L-alanyl-D-glutamate endopeptidase CwlK